MSQARKVVVLNPKGGSGKTTLSVNLASYYAASGVPVALMDYDAQGSSSRWLKQRPPQAAGIEGISAYRRDPGVTRSFQLRIPPAVERVVVDTPAAPDRQLLIELARDASVILMPVLPSDIDIDAASRSIADLLLVAKVRREEARLAVVANRVRRNTRVYRRLDRFLTSLQIPFIGRLRDTQNYVRTAELGVGIFEMRASEVQQDLAQWKPILRWVENRLAEDGANPVELPQHFLAQR